MFDIGLGEIIALAVIALIVFGPDRLPKAAAQGGKAIRQLREMAANARKELGDSAGLDTITEELRSLQDLHPKRIIASALEAPANGQSPAAATAEPEATSGAGAAATSPAPEQPVPKSVPKPVPKPAPGFDPDAT